MSDRQQTSLEKALEPLCFGDRKSGSSIETASQKKKKIENFKIVENSYTLKFLSMKNQSKNSGTATKN